jgi:hypothetical protein
VNQRTRVNRIAEVVADRIGNRGGLRSVNIGELAETAQGGGMVCARLDHNDFVRSRPKSGKR